MTKTRIVQAIDDIYLNSEEGDEDDIDDSHVEEATPSVDFSRRISSTPSTRRVQTARSPWIDLYHHHMPARLTVDTGAEVNMIQETHAHNLGIRIIRTSQKAKQADGSTPLNVTGEIDVTLFRNKLPLRFQALVCTNIDDPIIAGIPFLKMNKIKIDLGNDIITFNDGSTFQWTTNQPPYKPNNTKASLLRITTTTTIWPDDFIELTIPEHISSGEVVAVEPRPDYTKLDWPVPDTITCIGNKIRLLNSTSEPIKLPIHTQICQILPTSTPVTVKNHSPPPVIKGSAAKPYSASIQLSPTVKNDPTYHRFAQLHQEYDEVFNPVYTGYNGAAGKVGGNVNMGPILPPQRKGRVPQYDKSKLGELQIKCDELEDLGVLQKPEIAKTVAEYLNPSFLIKKPSGGYRLVTAFTEIGRHSKPQPSLMPNVDSTLRQIGQWKYIIKTDLTNAFYQIPLSNQSYKYCGIVTPFKGVRVYTRCAMGMPGSETALEELMCRVIGHLIQEGIAAKVADDLYVGGETLSDLADNWTKVLEAMQQSNLKLAPGKTEIAPQSTTILG